MTEIGKLYLVATPIGNLEDMSIRGLNTLKEADIIAAEDTRVSGKLLSHFGISKRLISYYEHNKKSRQDILLRLLREGNNIALISDAGTPAISDPGADIAAAAIAEGIPVIAIPGASAVLTVLAASGRSTSAFCFEGFLPREKKERRLKLEQLAQEKRTLVLYEAPHRLKQTLTDLAAYFGAERGMSIGRELTKLHEEMLYGTIAEMQAHFETVEPRGEFALVIEGCPELMPEPLDMEKVAQEFLQMLADGYSRKDAAKVLAAKYDCKAKQIYEIGLKD